MLLYCFSSFCYLVALRKESVDRNLGFYCLFGLCGVALRKESVDRNEQRICDKLTFGVALRKESVDRNVSPLHAELQAKRRSPQGERG